MSYRNLFNKINYDNGLNKNTYLNYYFILYSKNFFLVMKLNTITIIVAIIFEIK